MSRDVKLVNFAVAELVSLQAYELFGDRAIYMFNREFVLDVDKFVSDLKADTGCTAVYVNTWKWGGKYVASGLRDSSAKAGGAGSQHYLGNALDLKFKGITVQEAFNYLIENQSRYPNIKRVEDLRDAPTWLHVDGRNTERDEIYVFRA